MLMVPVAEPVMSMNVSELAPDGSDTGPDGVIINLLSPLSVDEIAKLPSPLPPLPCPRVHT